MDKANIAVETPVKKRALVVDDGPVERLAGKTMLQRLGYVVHAASSAEEALQLLDEHTIHLVLCDISMPGMDGLSLLAMTRSQAQPPLFIMSTSHEDAEHAFASLRHGASGYMTKPLRFDSLRDTVAEAVAKHHDEQDMARKAAQLAQQDSLTKLMNKGAFSRRLARRLENTPAGEELGAILLIKVHGLNHINHSYGRAEGDKVLQFASKALTSQIRPADILARFGGNLFCLYIDGITPEEVEHRAASIAEGVESTKMVLASEALSVSLVIGGACATENVEVDDLLSHADFALHLAREQGRHRLHIYSEADEIHKKELSHQLNTLTLVRAALNDPSRIVMHYQPIITLATGKVSHFEALLRLTDDAGKLCNTGELVKTCEVFGLIGRLDRAVVKACFAGMSGLPEGTGIAINLSGKSIGDPELLRLIESQIENLNIDPSRIIFELTETATFFNLDEVRNFVKRIKDLGCRFALDDFGVGFSSFYYIKELDFDYLKLDGSFIKNLPRNPSDQVFVRAMVEISRVFGLSVIAEWVEDRETAEILHSFGVAYGQGYYFGKPLPLSVTATEAAG